MLEPSNRILPRLTVVVVACSVALLPFALGCAGYTSTANTAAPVVTTSPTPATVTDVYAAGVDYINGVSIATVWKNGVETQIGAAGLMSYANGIVRVGSDIYVAGEQSDGVNLKPVVWKNGVALMLPALAGAGGASGITSSGSDVYVCGFSRSVDGKTEQSDVWKNGVANAVPTDVPNAVALSGTDVYVAGFSVYADALISAGPYASAELLKNNIVTRLDQSNNHYTSSASAIAVQGSDVYVGGDLQTTASGVQSAALWKNGVPTLLSTDNGTVYSVFINGPDVYAGGMHGYTHVSSGDPGGAATVWKNGVALDYSVDAAQSIVLQVTVSSNTLYAVGFTDKGAYLWKDGVATVLPSISTKATANGITVYEH